MTPSERGKRGGRGNLALDPLLAQYAESDEAERFKALTDKILRLDPIVRQARLERAKIYERWKSRQRRDNKRWT